MHITVQCSNCFDICCTQPIYGYKPHGANEPILVTISPLNQEYLKLFAAISENLCNVQVHGE